MTDTALWAEAAKNIFWYKTPAQTLDDHNPPFYRWFPDGMTNACYNAVDLHVDQGRGEQSAVIYDSPVTDCKSTLTFRELQEQVARFAGVLADMNVTMGDRVIIYMPMVPEALIAMLACARIGAIHSVVFGGFASTELAERINDAQPRVIVTASCGIEPGRLVAYKPLLDQAIELTASKPDHCIILQRPQLAAHMVEGRDVGWAESMSESVAVDCVPVSANHPLYILYTSGTTGRPKGVVRDTGGSIVALKWSMANIYNVKPGDVYWAASDVGWVVGHSYIVYGPLFNGNTTLIYEGKPVGTPDPGAFWRVIEEHQVKVLFTAPTAIRAIKKEDPEGELLAAYDLGCLQSLFLAGERCDPDTLHWARDRLHKPVIDHWWQTETGWSICATCLGRDSGAGQPAPVVTGSPGRPVPGYEVAALDSEGQPTAAGDIGALVIRQPLPPGTFTTLWNGDERYIDAYFTRYPGFYETGDAGYIDSEGYVFVMSRTDDVINVAGHRLSTGALEEVLAGHPDVAECAVFGVADSLKGQLPLGLLVLKAGVKREHQLIIDEAIRLVREQVGPVAAFRLCGITQRLPKTRSGKILRATMRSIADKTPWKMPATIDDQAVLDEIETVLYSLR